MRIVNPFCALAVLGVLLGCTPAGPANSGRVITGTITVPLSADWANVRLGVFSGGALGSYPKLDVSDYLLNDETKYRLIYYDSGVPLNTDEVIPPLGGTSYSIADTSGTTSSYSFELPSTMPQIVDLGNREDYYLVLWYDTGATPGSLDLKNAGYGNDTIIKTGEFTRCATKVAVGSSGGGKLLAIQNLLQGYDIFSGNPTGTYWYYGYSHVGSYNEYEETSGASDGFNFTVTDTTVW